MDELDTLTDDVVKSSEIEGEELDRDQVRSSIARRLEAVREGDAQTTALVNEAYPRLVRKEPAVWENRAHFFGAAAEAMRRILIDHARRRRAERRGGGAIEVPLPADVPDDEKSFDLLAVDEALDRLAALRPRAVRVVGFRFWRGLTGDEAAKLLDVSTRTVEKDWKFASAWLRREIEQGAAP